MDIAKKGKIHNLCMPNAILTFKEYLLDYASEETRQTAGYLIDKELAALPSAQVRETVTKMLERINQGERDLFL